MTYQHGNDLYSDIKSNMVCVSVLNRFSRVLLFVTLRIVAVEAPLSMGILQARILEWVAMPSSRESSQPRDRTLISYIPCISRRVLYHQCQLGSPRQHQQQINWQPDLRTRLLMSLLLRAAWLIKEPISSEQPGRQYSINFSYHIYFICTAIIILLSH